MRSTIKDVASLSGVSVTTVSLIINHKDSAISPQTRQRVKKAIDTLNYRPNQLAVSLATNTTHTVGVILPDSTNPFFARLASHMEAKLRQQDLTTLIANTGDNPMTTRKILQVFNDRCVDGIILAQTDFGDEIEAASCQKLIDSFDLPVVFVDRVLEGNKCPSVEVDQKQIGYLATSHLLALGHRKIGCIAGPLNLKVNASRYDGYCQAMEEYGLSTDENLLYSTSFTIEAGAKALPYLLGQNVSAIFTFNDMIAYGIYKECRNYNISIPHDLSVVGVDDIAFSDILAPPLTTVAQPIEDIADQAVEALMARIAKKGDLPRTILKPHLNVRGSTCAVANCI